MKVIIRLATLAGAIVLAANPVVAAASSGPPSGTSPNPTLGAIGAPVDALFSDLPPSAMPSDTRPVLLPDFIGASYLDGGVYEPPVPANPFLAAGSNSQLDNDTYRSDTYPYAGPVGNDVQVASWTGYDRECTSMSQIGGGRVAGICYSVVGPWLTVFSEHATVKEPTQLGINDGTALEKLAQFQLPARDETTTDPTDFKPQNIGGGFYYVDNHGRFVIPTATNHIVVISISSGMKPTFHLDEDYNLTGLDGSDKALNAMPDSDGNIWFVTRQGLIGTINPATGAIKTKQLSGEFDNGLAADTHGNVFAVTTNALYELRIGRAGAPTIEWSEDYPNDREVTPPLRVAGSGTTPTLLDNGRGDYVAIADNADPIDVRVYRRNANLPNHEQRLVCSIPVFPKGASETGASLIGDGNSIVVTNEAGYDGPGQTPDGIVQILEQRLSDPGMVRIDINPDGAGCHIVWTSVARIWSGVPKLSTATGLIYGSELAVGQPLQDVWYMDAISFKTGAVVFQKQYGSGITANPDYSSLTITPDGSVWIGALVGMYRLWDGTTPARAVRAPAPSLKLVARGHGTKQRYAVTGPNAVDVLRLVVHAGSVRHGLRVVSAKAFMVDAGVVRLQATFRPRGS